MLGRGCFLATVAVMLAPTFAMAEELVSLSSDKGMAMLQRVANAAQTLSYSGVFVYRSGDIEETSRIAHAVVGGREVERIEVLDGSAREVIRDGQDIRCFLPAENRVIVERQSTRRSFPALLSPGLANVSQFYSVRGGAPGRVAGVTSQTLVLEPRDAMRYGHQLSVDADSGLLLKAGLINENGKVLESFTFTELSLGEAFARQHLTPSAHSQQGRVQQVQSVELRSADSGWAVRKLPPGFRILKMMLRKAADGMDVEHIVISDGLAAVSVFIEPAMAQDRAEGLQRLGAISLYRRQLGVQRAVVIGEVPLVTVKQIGDGIEKKAR